MTDNKNSGCRGNGEGGGGKCGIQTEKQWNKNVKINTN